MTSDESWDFRLEARLQPSFIPGGEPVPVWILHTAVKPVPGLELKFVVPPVAPRHPEEMRQHGR